LSATPRKVVLLSLVEIDTILFWATGAPQASDVEHGGASPVSRPTVPELRASIVSALERAKKGPLLDGPSYHVSFMPDEGEVLSQWCRDAAPSVGGSSTDALVAAAAKIDAT
jgi:hypothetical protein